MNRSKETTILKIAASKTSLRRSIQFLNKKKSTTYRRLVNTKHKHVFILATKQCKKRKL